VVSELQHRTRNLFSTIGAIVYSTLKSYPAVKEFRRVFEGRMSALLRAHTLALETAETDLRVLVTDLLAPYSVDHLVEIEGPGVTLAAESAVAFSVALHELATNATKYGALSPGKGKLAIRWDVSRSERGDNVFSLEWRESGGPSVTPPLRSGFGSAAITKSLANAVEGDVDLDFSPTGLVCSIRAPMSARLGALTHQAPPVC
jgi:two-component sensor histidine kinase